MADFTRNNLGSSSSPYLRQHAGNPVHWQEWTAEALAHAKKENQPIFLSIGYSTCHWCHVMAAGAFSDLEAAGFLNSRFVPIKVDREQRPDIDRHFMDFMVETTGQGGWPLNLILTPGAEPIAAFTYLGAKSQHGLPAFIDVLRDAAAGWRDFERGGKKWKPSPPRAPGSEDSSQEAFLEAAISSFDLINGGFGSGHKFPPHCTLLLMLAMHADRPAGKTQDIIRTTLGAIESRGLHDHLQGGFFRYCVDREWTIPHFEKMLYDQALLLWSFSEAYAAFCDESYKRAAEGIIKCLRETFLRGGVYICAHDADTGHEEGATYLWSHDELKHALSPEEFAAFSKAYDITREGNFEGKNHLVRAGGPPLPKVLDKLLAIRKSRLQPFADGKIITSWNALAGVGLVAASRRLGRGECLQAARALFGILMEKHWDGKALAHSSFGATVQRQEFLEDCAAMLLFSTFIFEETGEREKEMLALRERVLSFNTGGGWVEARQDDFTVVAASSFDSPLPSPRSLAEMALLWCDTLLGRDYPQVEFGRPLSSDFASLAAMASSGGFHIIRSPKNLPWERLPLNTIQCRAAHYEDCHGGICMRFKDAKELLRAVGRRN